MTMAAHMIEQICIAGVTSQTKGREKRREKGRDGPPSVEAVNHAIEAVPPVHRHHRLHHHRLHHHRRRLHHRRNHR